MSDDAVMRTANDVAPYAAVESIIAAIERDWQCEDGPAQAFVRWEIGEGVSAYRNLAIYTAWGFGGPLLQHNYQERIPRLGHKSLGAIVEWFPDAIRQWVVRENEASCALTTFQWMPIAPETHKLLWRARPMIEWDDKIEAWMFYARLAFVPKDAKLLEIV